MDIKNFLKEYLNSIKYEEEDGGYFIGLPFEFYNNSHITSLFIKDNKEGYYDISDCGNTIKYLKELGVEVSDYKRKVETICKIFGLRIEDDVVKGVIGFFDPKRTYIQLHKFLQGISHLSTLLYMD